MSTSWDVGASSLEATLLDLHFQFGGTAFQLILLYNVTPKTSE